MSSSLSSTNAVRRPSILQCNTCETTEMVFVETWTPKIDAMLFILRENCNYMSKYHNFKYQKYKERLKWFRIPIIVLSAINAFTALGLQAYVPQRNISTVNSILSLLCGILTSVELFLNIQKKMENDLVSHKDYYVLGMDIFKMVSLDLSKRNANGREFLEEKMAVYKKLIQSSNIIDVDFYIDIVDDDEEYVDNYAESSPNAGLSNAGLTNTNADDDDIEMQRLSIKKPHKPRVWFKQPEKDSTTSRVARGLEKICTPNNHRINKYHREMKSHIQKYSKTIRPQFMTPGATETVYTSVGRSASMEDASFPRSGSGKGYYGGGLYGSPREYMPPRPQPGPPPPSMYDIRTPTESFYREHSPSITKTPLSRRALRETEQAPILLLPAPPTEQTVAALDHVNIENPDEILTNREHKDAGVEASDDDDTRTSYSSSILGAR